MKCSLSLRSHEHDDASPTAGSWSRGLRLTFAKRALVNSVSYDSAVFMAFMKIM